MRMGVGITGCTVCCPSGMTDSGCAGIIFAVICFFAEVCYTSGYFGDGYFPVVYQSDSCRIIASVFKFFKSFKEYGRSTLNSGISNYSTHIFSPLFFLDSFEENDTTPPSPCVIWGYSHSTVAGGFEVMS